MHESSGKNIQTIIGASVKVDGKFHGQGDIIIEGSVAGSVKTDNNVVIGAGAKVAANITAANAQIAGEVQGAIKIKGRLDLKETARIIGDIETETLSVAPGALINGKCTMMKESEAHAMKTSAKKVVAPAVEKKK